MPAIACTASRAMAPWSRQSGGSLCKETEPDASQGNAAFCRYIYYCMYTGSTNTQRTLALLADAFFTVARSLALALVHTAKVIGTHAQSCCRWRSCRRCCCCTSSQQGGAATPDVRNHLPASPTVCPQQNWYSEQKPIREGLGS